MRLSDIVNRTPLPAPWAEGDKIPWNDPDFSRRMLAEHLSQAHDAASRRFDIVDRHVAWIFRALLGGRPARVLDLGCGPGLYASRLARLGCECTGIDFGPASIVYARGQAQVEGLPCTYVEQDVRTAEYGQGYALAMFLYGEINVFRPAEARAILERAGRALAEGGALLLEVHTFDVVRRLGQEPPAWYSAPAGLWSDRPHLVLTESFWDPGLATATERYFIVDAQTAAVTRHAAATQAYTADQYRALLESAGLPNVAFYPTLDGTPGDPPGDFVTIVARRP
jgi:SAM-dependent methyltransferase